MFISRQQPATSSTGRRGAAAVEFAVISPLFVLLALSAAQSAFNVNSTHSLYAAIRQAGRIASMDTSERLQAGQSINQKVMHDIKNQLTAAGLPGDQMTVTITDAETDGPFNLGDASNDLKLFRIKVSVPYSALNYLGSFPATLESLSASIVFRKGRTTLVN